MNSQRRPLAILGAILLLLVVVYSNLEKKVTILVDGTAIVISTKALTVSQAINDAEISIRPGDTLEPKAYSFIGREAIVAVKRASLIHFMVNGEMFEKVLNEQNPRVILDEFGVSLGDADRLLLAGQSISLDEELPSLEYLSLEIRRAAPITIVDGGEEIQILSSATTVGEVLSEAGVALNIGDEVTPEIGSEIAESTTISISRANPIEIQMDGESLSAYVSAKTVGEALTKAGVSLQGLDYSIPAEEEAIPADGSIQVVRVREQVQLETQTIPYTIEWQADPETEIDGRSVIQLGQNGIRAASIRIRYEDGEEVARWEENDWVLAEAVPQISGYGTNIVVRSAVVDGVEIEYWRTLELFATSYSPCRSGVEACYYYTALGDEVKKGIAAVYLSWWYAMGQHTVFVPGYGPAKISDNGAYPDGRPWIDLAYSDADWVTWGDWVTVYFTTPIPPDHEILYILP